ncbi:MAG: hypothetical protein ABSF70_03515 [Terracidiphilus sp.]|jgi:hypothetical protein
MSLGEWVKSNADYGRRLVDSGIEGARHGQDDFLDGEPLVPFLGESVKGALVPAAIGACVGVLVGYPICRRKSTSTSVTLAYGLLGCAIGLGAGFAWKSRHLSASVAGNAMKNIGKVRDEHWLSKNPINYA